VPTNLCSVLKEYARIQGGGRYAQEMDLKKGKMKAAWEIVPKQKRWWW
jgi:hypothetical protein